MAKRDIIVIGGSAGALDALQQIVSKLPDDLKASVFVVIHLSPSRESQLPQILTRDGRMPAGHAEQGQEIKQSRIYIAPPDLHLLLSNRHMDVVHGPKENRVRPAIDPLFRSAALNYGPRVIGVVLSGALDDGTAGLRAIKQTGGMAIVQDPEDASYPPMPQSAILNNPVDHVVPAAEIGPLLRALVEEDVPEKGATEAVGENLRKEVQISRQELESPEMIESVQELGRLTMFTCPECHGTLWEMKDNEPLRYRCHVGHAFSADSLDAEQGEKLEAALWFALRALEERGALSRRLARQARARERNSIAQQFEKRAAESDEHVESIRQILRTDPDRVIEKSA